MPSQPHAVRQLSQRESRSAAVRLLPLPLGEVALRSNDGEGKDADERKNPSMNEPEKIDPRELSPLALAFVGDSVLELLVRQRLVEHHRLSAGKLNAEKVKYVSARAQFREEQLLEPLFTEDELAVFKRGRNASKASVAKHASPEEYRASTGFECLLGWLYLNGRLSRVHELFETLWQSFDPNEK